MTILFMLIKLLLVIGALFIMKNSSYKFKNEKFMDYLHYLATSKNKATSVFKIVYSITLFFIVFGLTILSSIFTPSADVIIIECAFFGLLILLLLPVVLINVLYSSKVKKEGKEIPLTSDVRNWFFAKGRIGRRQYLMEMFTGIILLSFVTLPPFKYLGLSIIAVLLFYYLIVLQIKRLHDCGWSGWGVLLVIIFPTFIVALSFIEGNLYDNKYGKARKIPVEVNDNSQNIDNGTITEIIL